MRKIAAKLKVKAIAGIMKTVVESVLIPKDVLAESIRKAADGFCDPIESHYTNTDGKIDDVILGSACKLIRAIAKAPDDDEVN